MSIDPSVWEKLQVAVPRAQFIPDTVWAAHDHGYGRVLRDIDPERWGELVDSDDPVVTQVDDGDTSALDVGHTASSSASAPSVVQAILHASQLGEDTTVLEIGAGTGWNAALLAHLVGPPNVTTVDVDGGVATQARESLGRAGLDAVTVAAFDGELGYPSNAPYDRVVGACRIHAVPYAWVEQTKPGGLIVTPYGNRYYNGALLRLQVSDYGTALGYFTNDTPVFMSMRSQRQPFGSVLHYDAPPNLWRHTTTDCYPYDLLNDHDAALAISLTLPDIHTHVVVENEQQFAVWFMHPETDSVSVVDITTDDTYALRQRGPRNLYDEAQRALFWWQAHGKPDRTRFGMIVNRLGTFPHLDGTQLGDSMPQTHAAAR